MFDIVCPKSSQSIPQITVQPRLSGHGQKSHTNTTMYKLCILHCLLGMSLSLCVVI